MSATKLPTFFSGVGITGVRIDPTYDIDVVPGHFHPLDQCPDEVALARPVRRLQAVAECGGTILQTADDQRHVPLHGGLVCPRLARRLQAGVALAQAGHPRCTRPRVDAALSITVDPPGDAWAQRALSDVHLLATRYGWSEREVLALTPARRARYLAMVSA